MSESLAAWHCCRGIPPFFIESIDKWHAVCKLSRSKMEKLNKSKLESLRLLIYPMTVTTASASGMEKHIVKATSWRWKRFRVELSHYNNQISYHPPRNCGPFLSFTTIFWQNLKTKKMLDAGSLPMVVCQKVCAWWTAGHCSQVIAHFFIIPSFFHPISFF